MCRERHAPENVRCRCGSGEVYREYSSQQEGAQTCQTNHCGGEKHRFSQLNKLYIPVAQMVEHGSTNGHGFKSQEVHELIKMCFKCKSLKVKASAICIDVNVI